MGNYSMSIADIEAAIKKQEEYKSGNVGYTPKTDKLPTLKKVVEKPVESKTTSVDLPKANSSALPDMNLAILSKPETNNDKIERWLNPSYKMSKEEKKEAKKLSDAFMSEVHNRKFDGSDEEYKRMTDLYNKSHTGAAVMAGIMDAVPFYDSVMDATLKAAGVDGSFSEYMDKTSENTRKQNPVAYTAANIGTNIGEYALGTKALEALGVLGKGGKLTQGVSKVVKNPKLASSVANVLGDTSLDVALDTVPTAIENAQSGMNGEDVAREAGKNIATNLAFNVGGEAVGNILPMLKKIDVNKNTDNIIDDVSKASSDIKENTSMNVGKATVIQSPYKGEVPTQAKDNFARIDITQESLNDARMNIETANIDSQLNGRNSKKILTKVYETLFGESGEAINVPVEGLTFGNKAYNVTVNKNAVGKIVSDKNFSAEKLAILDNIDNVIENSKYVGSGDYVNYKNSNKNVSRYDYFETMCKIDGEDYVVSFDVEVVPGSNNYRTHKVINEINLSKVNQLSTDMGPAPTVSVDSRKGLFNSNISNPQNNVNDIAKEVAKKFDIKDYPDATDAYKSTKKNIHNMFNMFGSKEQEEVVMKAVDEFVENPSIEKYIEVQTLLGNEADKLVGTEYHYKGNKAQKLGKTRKFDKEYDYMSAFDSVDELYNSVRDRAKANANKVMTEDIGIVPTSESIEIPVEGYGDKVSKARTNTLANSGINTSDELSNPYLDESNFTYESISEKESMDIAASRISEGVDKWKGKLMSQDEFTGADIDTMMMIYSDTVKQARESGNEQLWKEAGAIFKKIQESGTKQGQAIQAFAKWSRNTPEGVVADTFRNVKDKITKQLGEKKAVEIVEQLTEELQKEVYELADTAFNEGLDSQAGKEAFAQIGKLVNKNTPKSLKGIVKSYLMDSMLLNFRTLISRNAGGNLGYNAMEFARQPITAGIDTAVSKLTGQRTRTGWSADKITSAVSGLAKGIAEEVSDIKKGVHTAKSGQNSITDAIYANAHPFKGNNVITKALNGIDDMTKHGLSVGDRPFYEAAYKQRLSELNNLRQRGLLSEEAMKLSDDDFSVMAELSAKIDGLTATYQDDGAMGKALDSLKKSVGMISKAQVGVDVLSQFVMPFTRTPGNIITRSLEYSPYGVVKNAVNTVDEIRKGNFNQQRFVDETGRNILGTGLFAGGIAAYDNGLITGGYSDDKDMANAQKQAGMQEYALNTGNGNFDISWLPVLGNDLVAAAAFKEAYNADNESEGNALWEGAKTGMNTLVNTSALQGMNRMFGGNSSYSTELDLFGNMKESLTSGFGQAIPAQLRQIVQTADPYQRSVANGDREYWQNSLMSSLPVLREQLQPKVDNEGNIMMQNQGRDLGSRIVENMISPGKYTELQDSVVNNEAMRLFESTGNNYAFLPTANRNDITDGDVKATDEQFFNYQVSLGSKNAETAQAVIESEFYNSLSDEEKETALSDVYKGMKVIAKEEALSGYSSDNKIAKAYKENGAQGVVDYMHKKHELESRGLKETDKTSAIYSQSGTKGLDEYAEYKAILDRADVSMSDTYQSIYQDMGAEALEEAVSIIKKAGGSSRSKLLPVLQSSNMTDAEKGEYLQYFGGDLAKGALYAKSNWGDAGVYNYYAHKNNADSDGNGSASAKEVEAYLRNLQMADNMRAQWYDILTNTKKNPFN